MGRRTVSLLVLAVLLPVVVLGAASCGRSARTSSTGSQPASRLPASGGGNTTGLPLTLPAGFSISSFADGLQTPRALAWDSAGNLLVSAMGGGQVIALPDRDKNGVADEKVVVAAGLNTPHGIAFLPSDPSKLYIAENDQVSVWDYDQGTLKASNKRKIIDLPSGGEHVTRTITFMPPPNQDKLLISVGSSANVTSADDSTRAAIFIANSDGSGYRPYAIGLRNSVFMAVHPVTGQVWATENGRDNLGDDIPPDEINIIKDGSNYGWPYYYGKNVLDTQFVTDPAAAPPVAGMTPSYIDLQAHSAPLGLAFVTASSWPADYRDNLLVAFHGSWNRSVPTGDKVVRIRLDQQGNFQGIEDFITGWQQPEGSRLGRPVGILFKQDGSAYISDDQSGVVYRLIPP
jgi:glucose/arabinose dehydrogenase